MARALCIRMILSMWIGVGPACPFAYAQIDRAQCGDPVNLNDPGQSMEKVPVFDQAATDTCYAHTTASMLTAYLHSHQPPLGDGHAGKVVSPLDSAMQEIVSHNRSNHGGPNLPKTYSSAAEGKTKTDSGGEVCVVFDAIKRTKFCDYNAVKALQNRTVHTEDGKAENFLQLLRELFENMRTSATQSHKFKNSLRQVNELVLGGSCSSLNGIPLRIRELDSQIQEIVHRQGTDLIERKIEFISRIFESACYPRKAINPSITCENREKELKTTDDKLRVINRVFGRVPAEALGIGYCSKLLEPGGGPSYRGLSSKDCGGHYSVLIGRRWNVKAHRGQGACEYLIRNSWGEQCDSYHDAWSKPEYCGKGNIWVDGSALLENTDELNYLNP